MTDQPRRIWAFFIMTIVLSASSACIDGAEPVRLSEVGDPCRSNFSFCVGPSSVQRCEDGVWTIAQCETVCGELGMAYVSEGCDETCDCALMDPEGCTPGDSVCASGSEVSVCDDAQLWSSIDCMSVCDDSGLASVGCMAETEDIPASCWCTSEGTPCGRGDSSICVDEAILAICVNETWMFQACDDICNGSGMCGPLSDPHECICR